MKEEYIHGDNNWFMYQAAKVFIRPSNMGANGDWLILRGGLEWLLEELQLLA